MSLIEKVRKILGRELTPDEEKDLKTEESQSLGRVETPKPAKETPALMAEGKAESLGEAVAIIKELSSKYDSILAMVSEERNARLASEKRLNEENAAKLNAKVDEKIKVYKEAGLIPNDNKDYESGMRKQLTSDFATSTGIYDAMISFAKPSINRNLSNEKTFTPQNNSNPTNSYNAIRETVKADINQSISNL